MADRNATTTNPKRLLAALLLVPVLLLALAAPAAAGEEWQSGTALRMEAGGDSCSEDVCTIQAVGVFSPGLLGGYLTVCMYRQTFVKDSNPLEILTDEQGCIEVAESAVIVRHLNPLTMRLIPTALTLTGADGAMRTVTVSMRQVAWEPTPAFRGTESYYDGDGCLNEVRYIHRSANARGKVTIDNETFRNGHRYGFVGLTRNRLRVTCP